MNKMTILLLMLFFVVGCNSVDEEAPACITSLENLNIYELPKHSDTLSWEYERSINLDNIGKSHLIGLIGSVNFFKQDYMLISDPIKKVIHVFDLRGNYLVKLGREGRGPGEFMQISSVKVIEDHLYVLDMIMNQLHIFSLVDLTFLRTTNISPKRISDIEELEGYLPRSFIIKSDGNLLIGFGETININEAEKERKLLYYEANTNGELISDQIIKINDLKFLSTSSVANKNPLIASFPFLPSSQLIEFSEDKIVFYRTDNFLIKKYSSEGKYLSSFYYKYPKKEIKRNVVKKEYPSEYHQKIIKDNELPDFWPILSSVYVDDENRFWVSMYSNPNNNVVKYLVLESNGKFIGQFELPKKYTLKTIRKDNLYVFDSMNPFVLEEYRVNF